MTPTDARGLPLTTTPAAAAHYRAGVDAWLRVQDGFAESMAAALDEDPHFALASSGLALDAAMRGAAEPAHRQLRSARLDVQAATDRERSHVAAIGARIQQPLHAAVEEMVGHVRRHPRDALAFSATMGALLYSGLPGLPERMAALCRESRAAYAADDWWWLGTEAFWAQEQGRYPESAVLAERALALDPRAGWAAHARAHVDDRTGAPISGLVWLDGWLAGGPTTAVLASHLHWHAALHELATGNPAAALLRFQKGIAPTADDPRNAVIDGASLLWRFTLRGVPLPETGTLPLLVEQVAAAPAVAFAALHAGLALAAAGESAALAALRAGVRRDARPAFADVVAPVLAALADFTQGRYAACAAALGSLDADTLARLGGSRVQRDVLEQTRIVALLRAGDSSAARQAVADAIDPPGVRGG
jgi:ElaB/YqjD/DUF883 family membrane-anchored ribosome-binding protein